MLAIAPSGKVRSSSLSSFGRKWNRDWRPERTWQARTTPLARTLSDGITSEFSEMTERQPKTGAPVIPGADNISAARPLDERDGYGFGACLVDGGDQPSNKDVTNATSG